MSRPATGRPPDGQLDGFWAREERHAAFATEEASAHATEWHEPPPPPRSAEWEAESPALGLADDEAVGLP